MKDIQTLKSTLSQLFAEYYFAVLATRAGDDLHTTLVAFTATQDLKTLFICTPRATRKYANLMQHPSVSLLVHNSSNQTTDIRQSIAVTISGKAGEVSPDRLEASRDIYLANQPHMSDFARAPNTAIIEITVNRYDIVTHFQDVTILEIQNNRVVSP